MWIAPRSRQPEAAHDIDGGTPGTLSIRRRCYHHIPTGYVAKLKPASNSRQFIVAFVPHKSLGMRRNVVAVARRSIMGQRSVPSDSIVVGDRIYRTTETDGDLMMVVASASKGSVSGVKVCVWRGDIYWLKGDGTGTAFKFMGAITSSRMGSGEWLVPLGKPVTKAVLLEEADCEF
jgi:hypothetical protein